MLSALHQAQRSWRFDQARALAAPLACVGDPCEHYELRRDGLKLAQRLALVEANLGEARSWAEALVRLHACQSDPERRRWARELLRQPPEHALPPLLAALEREPQATALVYALLLVLRRAGWLELGATQPVSAPPAPAEQQPTAIPPTLWLLRRYSRATPALEQRQARWQELHPGWQLHWLDYQSEAIEAMAELPELVRQSVLCVGDAAVRGDLLRLALLWQHCGVAVDFGIAPRQGLEPLLAGRELLLLQDGFGGIDGALWAAPPRHPWVEAALLLACRNVIEGQGYSRWDLTGSCLLSGVTARWLLPQLPAGLPAIAVLSPAEQEAWLQVGAKEPAPEGVEAPKPEPLLNRRRCSWLRQHWGQYLPPLSLAITWPRLAAAEGQPELTPPELAAWLLLQPSPNHSQELEGLLTHPPSWRELFPLHQAVSGPAAAEAPDLDGVQRREAERQGDLNQMSFGWLPLAGQFHHTLQAIQAKGRKAWIVDLGSHSGRSAHWLASRWAQAKVLCFVQRQEDWSVVAHSLAGTKACVLAARPLAGDRLQPDAAGAGPLRFPLQRLQSWLAAEGGEPLLLHLDAGMEGFAELFAQGGDWLACFPLVLLHGALLTDAQGRLLPQPHQQALAAAGFELVRSGEGWWRFSGGCCGRRRWQPLRRRLSSCRP